MIHTILEWRKSSEKPMDENSEEAAQEESLHSPACDTNTEEQNQEEEEEEEVLEGEDTESKNSPEKDPGDTNEHDSDDESECEGGQDDVKLRCVEVTEQSDTTEENTSSQLNQPLLGLVLTPTRELAVQVKHHIDAVAKFTGELSKLNVFFLFDCQQS